MKTMKQKTSTALVALVLILGACKGESPTAPPPGTGVPPGTPPPAGAVTINLTASNANPLVDSSVVITATVTQDGQPVPNGTAVEFQSTGGGLDGSTATSLIKTTTNGVATVTLTAAVAGTVTVQATIGNVSRQVSVAFRTTPPVEPPPNTAPTITSVTPEIGFPSGGQIIRITGTNFTAPVRVLFDVGQPLPVEGFVTNVTPTTIDVTTPSVNLGAGQELVADIIVITQAGTATEQRVERTGAFTFRNERLEPRFTTASPNSGPVTGRTTVTIFGDGFQAPVQVLFGAAEARVITVEFSRIVVESPAARDTSPGGSGTVTGFVPITIRNINSQTSITAEEAFRYIAALDITSFRPVVGPATGGTDITIDGTGFVPPVNVMVAGQQATVIRANGTQILVRTSSLPTPCAPASGAVIVTNVDNGDFEIFGDSPEELQFQFQAVQPFITSITPGGGVAPGGSLTVVVRDPGVGPFGAADIRFAMLDRILIPSPSQITQGAGPTTFSVAIPTTGFDFPTVACTTAGGLAGERLGPVEEPLTFTNVSTGCSNIATVIINPPAPNVCLSPPTATVTTPAGAACATPDDASVTGVGFPSTTTEQIVIANGPNAQPLNITNVAISGSDATEFRITPTTASNIAAGGSQSFTLTFDPTTAGVKNATVTFTTNSPTTPTLTVCVQATAAP